MTITNFLAVGAGGALGAIFRYLMKLALEAEFYSRLPLATLTVNTVGALLIGLIMGYFLLRNETNEIWHNLLVIGFLGSFTTFSTFSIETLRLLQDGLFAMAMFYIVGSIVMCLGFTWLGLWFAERYF